MKPLPVCDRNAAWVKKLSAADKKSLCGVGQKAWSASGKEMAPFTWRGRKLIAAHSCLRLLIYSAKLDERVICRWDF